MGFSSKTICVYCLIVIIPLCCRAQNRNLNDATLLRSLVGGHGFERENIQFESLSDYERNSRGSGMSVSYNLDVGRQYRHTRQQTQPLLQPTYSIESRGSRVRRSARPFRKQRRLDRLLPIMKSSTNNGGNPTGFIRSNFRSLNRQDESNDSDEIYDDDDGKNDDDDYHYDDFEGDRGDVDDDSIF